MNVVDSSAWLEYFAAGPNAPFFSLAIEKPEKLIVPSLTLYEVFRRVLQQRNENDALQAVTAMQQGGSWISTHQLRSGRHASALTTSFQ